MSTVTAVGISDGVALAPLKLVRRQSAAQTAVFAGEEAEWARFLQARDSAIETLGVLARKAAEEAGESAALLFETHQMMAEDPDLEDGVSACIREQHLPAEQAVLTAAETLAEMLAAMEDEYLRERSADVRDVAQRIADVLTHAENDFPALDAPVILAADDLSPSETIQLDKSKLKGIVLFGGTATGHTAILARTLGIPAVIHADRETLEAADGATVFVNGHTGEILLSPEGEALDTCREALAAEEERRAAQERYRHGETVTRDGRKIQLFCNIGSPEDAALVTANGGEGVGLFRSEFLFLRGDTYPTEEEQFAAYKATLEALPHLEVIIRTCDIGSDKRIDYFELPEEENPALGTRAIRLSFARPALFKIQMRALYRASAYGKLSVMFPMIASVWELEKAKEVAREVQEELRAEGVPFDETVRLGVMIETPAAAVISDQLAAIADFFSVGTNDLTQYTLACDRGGNLGAHFDPRHPAVLRLIQTAAENAHKAGIPIGICGELGADPTLTEWFLNIGIDELSVAPNKVPVLRQQICKL